MLFDGPIPVRAQEPSPVGEAQNELTVKGELNPQRSQTVLRLPTGEAVMLPTELLLSAISHAGSQSVFTPQFTAASAAGQALQAASGAPSENIIPLFEEHADISKKLVETGKVRIQRSTETFNQTVTLPLTSTTWEVERIPVGELIPNRPEVRQDGDVTIYPLVEERFVAKREYFLIEEVHVRRNAKTTEQTATLELQRDVLSVDRQSLVEEPLATEA